MPMVARTLLFVTLALSVSCAPVAAQIRQEAQLVFAPAPFRILADACAKCNLPVANGGCKCDSNCNCLAPSSAPPDPCAKCNLPTASGGCQCDTNCNCLSPSPPDPCAKCNIPIASGGCQCDTNCNCVSPPLPDKCNKCNIPVANGGCKCNDACDCLALHDHNKCAKCNYPTSGGCACNDSCNCLDGSNPFATPSTDNHRKKTAVIVGATIGAVAACAILVALFAYWHTRRSRSPQQSLLKSTYSGTEGVTMSYNTESICQVTIRTEAEVQGLTKGDPFLLGAATEYSWASEYDKMKATAVMAGVNDTQHDKWGSQGHAGPVVLMSKQQVQEQLLLLKDGLLGKGASAFVFKCLWPNRFGRNALLAVKVLNYSQGLDQHLVRAFTYEATILASLQPSSHPNVVRLYGYCLEPPTICLVLELLPGSLHSALYPTPISLYNPMQLPSVLPTTEVMSSTVATETGNSLAQPSTYVTATTSGVAPTAQTFTDTGLQTLTGADQHMPSPHQGVESTAMATTSKATLPMLRILQISIDVTSALVHLHRTPVPADVEEQYGIRSSGASGMDGFRQPCIVHRDLKPANILLDVNGRAKLSDFGLARQQLTDNIQTYHAGVGTLQYMAPELLTSSYMKQITGISPPTTTHQIDIYALGMIMWEMVAGERPWRNMHGAAIAAEVLIGHRPDLNIIPETDPDAAYKQRLLAIVQTCWQQQQHLRPTAAEVYQKLSELLQSYTQEGTENRNGA